MNGDAGSSTGVWIRGPEMGAARAMANTDDESAQMGRNLTMMLKGFQAGGFRVESCPARS